MPFGEEIYAGVGGRTTLQKYSTFGADNIRKRFTGYEKDTETDLDFAQARMYQNKHGRFTTVDPLMASASIINPQTFNRYTYTGNNPINYTDPSGLRWVRDAHEIYWIEDNVPLNGREDVTGQTLTLGGGCDKIAGCARDGAVVTFNEDRSITIHSDDEGNPIISVTVEIINVTQEIIETTVSEISSTIGFSSAPTTDAPTIDLPTGGPGGGPLEPTGGSAPDGGSDPGGGEIDPGSSGDWQVDVAKLLWFAGQVWWNTSGGSDGGGEDEIELYRGVSSPREGDSAYFHERFRLATLGTAIPRGGHDSPEKHNAGDTDSIFTSWTTDERVAEGEAKFPFRGVILTKKFPVSRLVASPDEHGESEVLVVGRVDGASVKWIPRR